MSRPVDEEDVPPVGKTSVRFGPAFLNWVDKDHLGLYRRLITVTNNGGGEIVRKEHEKPVGPLGVYRKARTGDRVDMRSSDPRTGEPMELTLEWKPEPGDDA